MNNFRIALLATVLACGLAGPASARQFSYTCETCPTNWGALSEEFEACRLGEEQSPIDISEPKQRWLAPVGFDYGEVALVSLDRTVNIELELEDQAGILVRGERFETLQFHFHRLSEHFLFGEQFDLELHLVHRSADGAAGDRSVRGAGRPTRRARRGDRGHRSRRRVRGKGFRPRRFHSVEADLLSLSGLDHHAALHRGSSVISADGAARVVGGSDRADSAGASRHQRRLRQRPPAAVAQRASNPDRREARCRMMMTTAMTALNRAKMVALPLSYEPSFGEDLRSPRALGAFRWISH